MNRRQRRRQAKAGGRLGAASAFQPAANAGAVEAALATAIQLHQAGQLNQAELLYKRVLEAEPSHHVALHFLGVVAHQSGKREIAIDLIDRAIALEPNYVEAYCNLGKALCEQDKFERAVAAYQKAVVLEPRNAEAYNNLGNAHDGQGKLDEAVAAYRTAIALAPDYAEAHSNLGDALTRLGKLEDAITSCETAIALNPSLGEAHNNLGNALEAQGRIEAAVAVYHRAVSFNPSHAEAHSNLGNALRSLGKFEESVASCQKAVALKPDLAAAHSNLGNTLEEQGKLDEAATCYRRAVALKPDFALAHSNLLFHLHYMPGLTLKELFAEHRRWNAQHAAPLSAEIVPHTNDRDPDRKIRVGFVSGSFRRHPTGYMITRAIEARDRAAWELFMYSYGSVPDDLTERIRAASDVWRVIEGMDDGAVARLVREDRIDILVDLTGHADRNRLLVFARKPAPVQAKWVGGQFNTTGMDAIDYFITDRFETPPGAEKLFTEEVVRMPDGYACYDPPAYAPAVGPLPARERGYVTFGCFNKLAKVNEGVVALWSRLLQNLPDARLVLKTRSLRDATVCARYHAMFEAHGVARERVDLLPRSPHGELLAFYNDIDIALDPFPYSGGLTTCEALWMGVPVVAMAGETFAGRHSVSHLHNVGLGDWVVESPEDYLAFADRWSRDLAALADLRAGLRDRMAASPLCDGARFAANLEAVFRTMWRRWRSGA